jgi:hypothetical protein
MVLRATKKSAPDTVTRLMSADDPPARIVVLNLHVVIHSCFHSLDPYATVAFRLGNKLQARGRAF